jgi:uncharacterized protein DUF4156
MRIVVATASLPLLFLVSGCASVVLTPEAEQVRVVERGDDVRGCTLLGMIEATGPDIAQGDSQRELRNRAAAIGADTVLLTSRGSTKNAYGAAYRCGSPDGAMRH